MHCLSLCLLTLQFDSISKAILIYINSLLSEIENHLHSDAAGILQFTKTLIDLKRNHMVYNAIISNDLNSIHFKRK